MGWSMMRMRSGGALQEVMADAMQQKGLRAADLAAIGITNQRETTVLWDRHTGQPVYNALVWQDTRVDSYVAELALDGGLDCFPRKNRTPSDDVFPAG